MSSCQDAMFERDDEKTSGKIAEKLLSRKFTGSSQLFRDKTDEWDDTHCLSSDAGPTHELGTNVKCSRCRQFQSEQQFPWGGNTPVAPDDVLHIEQDLGQPPSPGNVNYVTSGFLQVICKECGGNVTGAWSYCSKHRCVGLPGIASGGTLSLTSEHLIGSSQACENCNLYNQLGKSVETKQTNPKDIIGSDKVPMGLVPAVTIAYAALGHLEGLLKYGAWNWREAGVRTSIYIDALMRHIQKFKDGEWADKTTQVPHLANALACISIIIDAYHDGRLIDDRPKSTDSAKVIDGLADVVKHLKNLHKDMRPTDYFIDGPKQRT
jgi:hypothetical protein